MQTKKEQLGHIHRHITDTKNDLLRTLNEIARCTDVLLDVEMRIAKELDELAQLAKEDLPKVESCPLVKTVSSMSTEEIAEELRSILASQEKARA